ncbi:MAG TPA: nucleoside-diphosphate sugar epimerase [Gammaproteobacteria bacterium]|nr:nucleoside-diphosphate sugar epimerase [Gammaproteobacteria bacterium]
MNRLHDQTATPRIWLVIGDKPGDNAQVEIIAEALGLPYETKRVLPRPEWVLGKPRFKASLQHLDLERSDRLEPPWPDLIITIGRRPSMAALWIQDQSGGHSKIVLLGRPKRWMKRFSLIIVPAQYRMPDAPNVLKIGLPLLRSNETAVKEAAVAWKKRFSTLERPITALLVGGATMPFRLDREIALDLLEKTLAATTPNGGTLYITTSRRTPVEAVEALTSALPEHAVLYRWGDDSEEENPYHALLALADRFVVTGDSMSMLMEVARRNKPLAIFPLPFQNNLRARIRVLIMRAARNRSDQGSLQNAIHRLLEWLIATGVAGYPRDLTTVHEELYARGAATTLGKSPPVITKKDTEDDLLQVVDRIKKLISSLTRCTTAST